MPAESLLTGDGVVPLPPGHPKFAFEVLGPEHNESDLATWSSSMRGCVYLEPDTTGAASVAPSHA